MCRCRRSTRSAHRSPPSRRRSPHPGSSSDNPVSSSAASPRFSSSVPTTARSAPPNAGHSSSPCRGSGVSVDCMTPNRREARSSPPSRPSASRTSVSRASTSLLWVSSCTPTSSTRTAATCRVTSLTPDQSALVDRYGGGAGRSTTPIPFLDIANRMVATSSAFSPGLLTRQSQADLVTSLDMPQHAAGQAIVAAANQLSAGLCLATGQQPASVCTSKGVQDAAASLGIR